MFCNYKIIEKLNVKIIVFVYSFLIFVYVYKIIKYLI